MKLSEDERHAIAHAEWAVSHATPEKPECCFDYTLVRTLIGLIKSGKASVGVVEDHDWPPAAAAHLLAEGYTARGSTGQLFEVANGQWVRIG